MGLFNFNNNSELEYYINKASEHNHIFKDLISDIDLEKYSYIFGDDKLFGTILVDISINNLDILKSLNNIVEVFNNIVKSYKDDEINLFKRIYNFINENLIDNNENTWNIGYYNLISSAFDNKEIALEALNNVKSILSLENFSVDNSDNMNKLLKYPIITRQNYIEDRALLSAFINLLRINGIRDYIYSDADINKIINKQIKEDKKQNGIYDIDRSTLSEISHKLDMIDNASSNLKTLINISSSVIKELKNEIETGKNELTELKLRELDSLQNKANKILSEFNDTYIELLSKEREALSNDRMELFKELDRELEKRKVELKRVFSDISSQIEISISRINSTSRESVRKIEDFINNNEHVKQMINDAKSNDEVINGLKEVYKSIHISDETSQANSTISNIIVPNIVLPKQERKVDSTINYFFNNSIPFSERFDKIQELKNNEIKNGEIYHEKFDDIIKIVMQGGSPYMYGPSGCGKTYMIEHQLAKLLGMNVLTNGYVLYEQDIIGYTNSATGDYVQGNFYRCYKYGDIIFLDELDNGIANATVVLNRFLGVNNKCYTFPDGVSTMRHPNFRIISAGNTNGSGRTLAHNTRQKMDESVMQRLTPIHVNYDNRVEKQILKDHLDWYYFASNFRKAIEDIPSASGDDVNTIGTFTTRDAQTVKSYLDNGVFDTEKILEYEIIQTKDIDTLTKISDKLKQFKKQGKFEDNSEKILKLFNNMVDKRRGK